MPSIRGSVLASLALGALSLVAVLVSHLALTDIYHGESNLTLEWRILQLSALVILAFQVVALTTLGRLVRRLPEQ
jgi:hypothetical protein